MAVGDWLPGQGFAYARYVHSKFPGYGAAWSAWVADVDVNRVTGEVHVKRVVVGHDAGLVVNPAGLQHQVHGNVLQTTSRALKESVALDPQTGAVVAREWGAYPILSFREVPVVEVVSMPRPGEPPLGAGESASVPGTAAIANAIFDATGVRLREPPFTPEVVRAAMRAASSAEAQAATGADASVAPASGRVGVPLADASPPLAVTPAAAAPSGLRPALHRRGPWATAAALATALLGLAAAALGWRPAIAPVSLGSATVYSAQTLERGRQLAALGNCVGCHTAPGGLPNAGGRAMETPFGTVYSSNLTPDPATGLGRWSFSAFQRAMREGISRDGGHLYPAFPYTAFSRVSDDDLQALYAHLLSQPAVAAPTPAAQLRFPFGIRPLMALWNALFLAPGPVPAVPAQSALWNRGAYLVEGLGHCSACHTPRNALGAEQHSQHFAGAMADGWEAPPLNALSRAPVAWNEEQLYRYLRHGHSPEHGSAGGPMASVVRQLSAAPEADLRAMAHYLGSLQQPAPGAAPPTAVVARAAERTAHPAPGQSPTLMPDAAQRLFQGACGACHHDGDGPMTLGPNIPLALNSQLHSDRPDNLLRTVLHGIREPATPESGQMPAFRDALDDAQVRSLVAWMRLRFAPGRPAWADVDGALARARAASP
jgi:nicotinate dehydrogenase subunit B